MSPEAERAAEVREWLMKAALDLRGAQIDLSAEPPLLEDALFRKTHSLEELGRVCCGIDSALTDLVDEAVPLTEYAWAFRYPGAPPIPSEREAQAALHLAVRVASAIAVRLPAAAVPTGFPSGS
jgi:hypothetical protein